MNDICPSCVWCKDGKTCSNCGLRIEFISMERVVHDLCFRSKYGSTSIIDDYKKEESEAEK